MPATLTKPGIFGRLIPPLTFLNEDPAVQRLTRYVHNENLI